MFLYIGKEILIKNTEIIGVFNIESMEKNSCYLNLIQELKKQKQFYTIAEKQAKTLILTKQDVVKGYLCNLSSQSIIKRIYDQEDLKI